MKYLAIILLFTSCSINLSRTQRYYVIDRLDSLHIEGYNYYNPSFIISIRLDSLVRLSNQVRLGSVVHINENRLGYLVIKEAEPIEDKKCNLTELLTP